MSKTDKETPSTRWRLSVLVVSAAFAVILALMAYGLGYDSMNEALTGYILGILALATVYSIPTGGK